MTDEMPDRAAVLCPGSLTWRAGAVAPVVPRQLCVDSRRVMSEQPCVEGQRVVTERPHVEGWLVVGGGPARREK